MLQRKIFLVLLFSILFQSILAEKCYVCDSGTDSNCLSDLSKITPTDCADPETNKICYTSVDTSGKLSRGCRADACSSEICQSCEGEGCNKHNICQTCDSSKNAECANSASISNTFTNVCKAEATKCLINIKDDKHTERHCATEDDVKACTDENKCKSCAEPNCNIGIFPSDRKRCFQCSSSASDSKCNNVVANSDTIVSKPCLLYDKDDKCYMFAADETTITRGCVSDTDNTNKCTAPQSNEHCFTCDASNCNSDNYKRNQRLRCIQCTSTTTDNKCLWGQNPNDALDCINQIEYNKEEACYTQLKDDITYRGCFYDRETSLGDCTSPDCDKCTSSDGIACNIKEKNSFTCKRCRSDNNPDCYNNADKIGGEPCRNPVTSDEVGCFHGLWNNVAIRGCLVDADIQTKTLCLDPLDNQCISCKEKDCNIQKSGAATLTAFNAIILIFSVLLIRWF